MECRREYVVRVLMKVVDGLTVDDAVNVMQVCFLICSACTQLVFARQEVIAADGVQCPALPVEHVNSVLMYRHSSAMHVCRRLI